LREKKEGGGRLQRSESALATRCEDSKDLLEKLRQLSGCVLVEQQLMVRKTADKSEHDRVMCQSHGTGMRKATCLNMGDVLISRQSVLHDKVGG
jgi:hypothetical protein